MKNFDLVQAWLDNIAYAHSKSKNTELNYRISLRNFYDFIESTPQQTLREYEGMTDRQFRRKYARYVRSFISHLAKNGLAINTVTSKVTAVRSFFKYNDLPLGYVPIAKAKVTYHNRDITKEEILKILEVSRPRDKAFFSMMTQSGQRPDTLSNLKLKHIDPDFSNEVIPCKIEVPEELSKGKYGAYFSFMAQESVKYLQAYLDTRRRLGPDDYLFAAHGSGKQLNTKSITSIFRRTIEKLKEKGIIDFEQEEEGKPRSVRLYNLRKYFRREAGKAGIEYVNFWMGHKTDYKAKHIPSSDVHYFSREDVDFQRQLYQEKAMPFLRLESATPTETEQTIMELRKRIEDKDKELAEFRKKLAILDDPELLEALRELKRQTKRD